MILITVLLILCAVNIRVHYCQEELLLRCSKNGVPGVCTTLQQCPDALQDIKNKIRPQHCVYGTLAAIVCCVSATPTPTTTQRTEVSTPQHIPTPSNEVAVDSGGKCDPLPLSVSPKPTGKKAWDKCLEYQDKLVFPCVESDPQIYSRSDRCLQHRNQLVTDGVTADTFVHPHMGLIGYGTDPANLQWLCVGSLISEKFVLTTGHCATSRDYGNATYVWLRLFISPSIRENNQYRIQRFIKHPDYKPTTFYNDIGLIELEKPVPLDEYIVPACLIGGDPGNSTHGSFSGFGATDLDGKPADCLKRGAGAQVESKQIAKAFLVLNVLCAASVAKKDLIGDISATKEPKGSTTEATVKTNEPCTTIGGEKGKCVPYYLCTPKTSGPIDIHISPEEVCETFIDICCTISDIITGQDIVELPAEGKVPEAPN